MTEQTRAHPRYAAEVDAEVRIGDTTLPVRTQNVSRGGMCFFASQALPVGRELTARMALVFDEQTFSEPLEVRGRVVWCTPLFDGRFQVGCAFVGLTNETRTYLDMFLRYLKEGQARQAEEEE